MQSKPIIALVGPSGAGKSQLIKNIEARLRPQEGNMGGIRIIRSITTRPRRDTPDDDIFYEHVDPSVFNWLAATGQLVQRVEYAGHYYGTRVEEAERGGIYALVEEGVHQLRTNSYKVVAIRVIPDSYELTMDSARRMADSVRAMSEFKADHIIHNSFQDGGLSKALDELETIIKALG